MDQVGWHFGADGHEPDGAGEHKTCGVRWDGVAMVVAFSHDARSDTGVPI